MERFNHKNCGIAVIILLISLNITACKPKSATAPEPSTQTTLPLAFDTGNEAPYGLPSTIITIGDKKLPVILDSGEKTAAVDLSLDAIKNLPIHFTGQQDCFQTSNGRQCEQIFIIPQVNIGTFTIQNVKGRLMTQPLGANDPIFKATAASNNGIIGFALLSQFNVLLDYPRSKMILIKPGNQPAGYDFKDWIVFPFDGHMQSSLILNGMPVTVSWNTAAIPSMISKTLANNFDAVPCPADKPYIRYNCSSIKPKSLITSDNHQLPDTWFKITDIAGTASYDAIIGSNFYQENLVYFDFDKHLVYVKHADLLDKKLF